MKSLTFGLAPLALLAFLTTGCSRPPSVAPAKKNAGGADPGTVRTDPFATFVERMRYPENPRLSDDWTRIREALSPLSAHFSDVNVLTKMRLTAEQRAFLDKQAHLDPSEFAEIESPSFRTADAHYLDECYLLRAAARSSEVAQASPMEQASLHFRWVTRNLLLHEQVDRWIPPAFALRRGHANAVDRALVFLALWRQTQGEGCLIVVPDSEPLQFLIAVHDKKNAALRLFDPRLETAIAGKDGKSIATLEEALADPALLAPSGITAEQAKKLEVWLAIPLYALSPRMKELQTQLEKRDPISLYLDAVALHRELSDVVKSRIPVKVWNPPAKADSKEPTNSPTRALRLFLPKQEGGIDEMNRARTVNDGRVPLQDAVANYTRVNITPELLPRKTWESLINVTAALVFLYDIQARELFLRGQYEALGRRHQRVADFARNETLAGLAEDAKFRKERADWLEKLRALAASDDPRLQGKIEQALQAMWGRDEYLDYLLDLEKSIPIDPETDRPVREFEKTFLTRLLAVGIRDHLHYELARSQAAANHDRAVYLHAKLRTSEKPTAHEKTQANETWVLARSAWGNYYLDRIALHALIETRLARLNDLRGVDPVGPRVAMLETLHLDVHKYFQARERFAEILGQLGETKERRAFVDRTKGEIDDLVKKGTLLAEVKSLAGKTGDRRDLQRRLDLLAGDWAERGSIAWLRQRIELQLKGGD